MNSQTKLTHAQLIVLSAASHRDDLRILLPARLRGSAADKMLTILIGKGLIEAIVDSEPGLQLQEANDSVATAYRISLAGLARIGISADGPIAASDSEPRCELTAPAGQPVWASAVAAENVEARDISPAGPVDQQGGPGVNGPISTGGVLGDQGSGPTECPDPDGHARPEFSAQAEPVGDRDAPAKEVALRAPRAGTKLDRIVDILSREAGATIGDLIDATGWLPHTARAALTGLRKRGYEVRLDRADKKNGPVYRLDAQRAQGSAA